MQDKLVLNGCGKGLNSLYKKKETLTIILERQFTIENNKAGARQPEFKSQPCNSLAWESYSLVLGLGSSIGPYLSVGGNNSGVF